MDTRKSEKNNLAKAFAERKPIMAMLKEKKYTEAIVILDKEIKDNPFDILLLSLRAEAFYGNGELEKGLADINVVVDLEKDNPHNYLNRAIFLYSTNQLELALKDINHVIDRKYRLSKAYVTRGKIYRKLSQFKQATHDFSQAIVHDHKNGEAYLARGNLPFTNSKRIADLHTAIDLGMEPNNTRIVLALIQVAENQLEKAKAILAEIKPETYSWLHFVNGIIYLVENKTELARTSFLQVLELSKERDGHTLYASTQLYQLGEKIDLATEIYKVKDSLIEIGDLIVLANAYVVLNDPVNVKKVFTTINNKLLNNEGYQFGFLESYFYLISLISHYSFETKTLFLRPSDPHKKFFGVLCDFLNRHQVKNVIASDLAFGDSEAQALASIPSLVSVKLDNNNITTHGASLLAESSIAKLNLDNNKIGRLGLATLRNKNNPDLSFAHQRMLQLEDQPLQGNFWELFHKNKLGEALEYCNQAITHQESATNFAWRSQVHATVGNLPKALQDITNAITLMPDNFIYYFYRIEYLLAAGETEKAKVDLANFFKLNLPSTSCEHLYAQLLLYQMGEKVLLEQYLDEMKDDNLDVDFTTVLILANAAVHRWDAARKLLARLFAHKGPNDIFWIYMTNLLPLLCDERLWIDVSKNMEYTGDVRDQLFDFISGVQNPSLKLALILQSHSEKTYLGSIFSKPIKFLVFNISTEHLAQLRDMLKSIVLDDHLQLDRATLENILANKKLIAVLKSDQKDIVEKLHAAHENFKNVNRFDYFNHFVPIPIPDDAKAMPQALLEVEHKAEPAPQVEQTQNGESYLELHKQEPAATMFGLLAPFMDEKAKKTSSTYEELLAQMEGLVVAASVSQDEASEEDCSPIGLITNPVSATAFSPQPSAPPMSSNAAVVETTSEKPVDRSLSNVSRWKKAAPTAAAEEPKEKKREESKMLPAS